VKLASAFKTIPRENASKIRRKFILKINRLYGGRGREQERITGVVLIADICGCGFDLSNDHFALLFQRSCGIHGEWNFTFTTTLAFVARKSIALQGCCNRYSPTVFYTVEEKQPQRRRGKERYGK